MEILEILYRRFASVCVVPEEGNNILSPLYLIGGSCLSRIILVKNSRSLKARPFGSSGPGRSSCIFVVFRRPGIHISIRAPACPRHRENPPIESFIILPSPPTISRAYPWSLNDVTMRRSMGIIHERHRSITTPAALSSLRSALRTRVITRVRT